MLVNLVRNIYLQVIHSKDANIGAYRIFYFILIFSLVSAFTLISILVNLVKRKS